MEFYRLIIIHTISHFLFLLWLLLSYECVFWAAVSKQPAAKKSVKKERIQAGRRGRIEVKTSDDLDEAQTCLTPEPVWKDGLTDWQTDSLANIYHHISKNIESKFWNIYLQLLLVNFFNFGTWAFRLNISVYIKNTYNRPRVCFCDLHKI